MGNYDFEAFNETVYKASASVNNASIRGFYRLAPRAYPQVCNKERRHNVYKSHHNVSFRGPSKRYNNLQSDPVVPDPAIPGVRCTGCSASAVWPPPEVPPLYRILTKYRTG